MQRKKHLVTSLSLLLIVLIVFLIWGYREIRQQTIDQTLIQAIKTGDEQKALAALAEGANGETRDTKEPLSFRKALQYLMQHFRHPNMSPTDPAEVANHLPALLVLYHMCYHGNHRPGAGPDPALVKTLLEHGAQVKDLDESYINSLWYASSFSNSDTVRILLAGGADVNSRGFNDETPLMAAVLAGNFNVVRVLLEHGANVSLDEEHGVTALGFATYAVEDSSAADARKIEVLLRKYRAK